MIRGALVLSILVLVAGAADLWVALRPARAPVSIKVMRRAAARIEAVKAPGDLIVHSPLLTVAELAPLGRLDARPDRPKAILRGRRRVLVLDLAASPMFGFGQPSDVEAVGEGLVLRTYPPTGDASGALWALSTALTPSTMQVERGAQVRPCQTSRADGGYSCAGEPDWLYAAVRVLRVGRQDRECVWAHPTTNGAIVFKVPAAPAPAPGQKLALQVQAGLVDEAVTNTPDGAPVFTDVIQGGKTLGRLTVNNRIGWFRSSFDLAPGREATLRITTPRDGRRHHCLRAQIVEVTP